MEVIILFQYAIRPGDTIYSIANQFNVSIDDLLYANPGLNPYNLSVGQIILIPSNYYPRYPAYPRFTVFPIFPIRLGFGFGGFGGRGDGRRDGRFDGRGDGRRDGRFGGRGDGRFGGRFDGRR